MVVTFDDNSAKRIGTVPRGGVIHLQVVGDKAVRIARDSQTLENLAAGGFPQGLVVLPSSGIVSLAWQGDIFGIRHEETGAALSAEIFECTCGQ